METRTSGLLLLAIARYRLVAAAMVCAALVPICAEAQTGFAVGSFVKSNCAATCTQTVLHTLGQAPKAIILWTDGKTNTSFSANFLLAYGFSDGTTSGSVATAARDAQGAGTYARRMANKVLTIVQWGPATVAEADLTSWSAANFVLSWTANDVNAYVIHYIVIGGSDVSAKVINWTTPTVVNASYAVAGVGFQPTVVIHAFASGLSGALPVSQASGAFGLGVMDFGGKQWATSFYSNGLNTQRAQVTNAAFIALTHPAGISKQGSWKSMDANGFTMNFSTVDGTASDVMSLALSGVNAWTGSFAKVSSTLGFVPGPPAQIAAQNTNSSTTNAQAFPAASSSGNLIIASIQYDSLAGETVSSIFDSNGNTYNLAVGPTNYSANYHVVTYYAANITGGATPITITVNLTGTGSDNFFELYQSEYSGVATVNPLDQVSSNSGTGVNGTAFNSGSKTTTQASELIYGFGASSGTSTNGASFTGRTTFDSNFTEDKNVAVIGSYNADGTLQCSCDWVAQMATFKAANNNQSIIGFGFQPKAVFLTSFQDIATAAETQSRMGIGASDGTTEGSSAVENLDAANPTKAQGIDKTSKAFMKVNNSTPTIEAEAHLSSMDVDGFTLNWTSNDTAATQILYLGLANLTVTAVRLTSLTATRYDRGVLVDWATGYEIDNLGFHVYRDIGGVKTRLTASPVAGSGLTAGHGVAVNALHRYAFWDLAAQSADSAAVYWLEDLDFNGTSTWHGPVTPTGSALQTPPVTAPSTTSTSLSQIGKDGKRHGKLWVTQGAQLERSARTKLVSRPVISTPPLETQWALAAQRAVKIGITHAGWYRVTQPQLVAAGLNPNVDRRTLRLFAEGVEHAIRVTGDVKGHFAAGDAIEFYGTGLDTPYTDARVYWLTGGTTAGQRIAVRERPARAGANGARSFWFTIQHKDRSIYFAGLENGDAENWFGAFISPDPTEIDLTLSHLDSAATAPAELEVTLQGVTSDPTIKPNHRVTILMNNTPLGDMVFDGQALATQTFTLPMTTLQEGSNAISLRAAGGDADFSLVDTVRLSYWHTYQAEADELAATLTGPAPVTIGGFASRAIRLVDISDPLAVEELEGAVAANPSGLFDISARAAGSGLRTLLSFTDATVAVPAWVRANRPSSWHDASHTAEYVALTHATFTNAAAQLVSLRSKHGLAAEVVDVENVYDEFSFGEKTPQAIKDFVTLAKTAWKRAPRFLTLIGDATIDPRDYAGFGDADFVPTKQVPMNTVVLKTASDDWFVDLKDDGLPDLAIGRLSVRTPAQAQTMVNKIAAYELTGDAPWLKDVLFVADQDTHNTFETASHQLETLLPTGYYEHELFSSALGSAALGAGLADQVAEGRLIVNYSGHGSVQVWGEHADLLTPDAVASWTNATRLPFVVAMNCLNGLFDGIYDEESLAETLMRAPAGGAVAVWASSSLTDPTSQSIVNQELFRLIFQQRQLTLGEAVAAAKRAITNRDLRRSWIFFGDPAMRLNGLPPPASETSVTPPTAAPVLVSASSTGAGDKRPAPATIAPPVAAMPATRLSDWDGDGRADAFLYAAQNWQVSVSSSKQGVRSGLWDTPWEAYPADLNGDGVADLLLSDRQTGTWAQAINDGAANFTYTYGNWGQGWDVHVGDLNGDGREDVLLTRQDSGLWFTGLSDGKGHFTLRSGNWPTVPSTVVLGDYNGDGRVDAFVYNRDSGAWTIAYSDGRGDFRSVAGQGVAGWELRAANLNSDTQSDLLLYNPTSGVWSACVNVDPGPFSCHGGLWAPGLQVVPVGDKGRDGKDRDDVLLYNPQTGAWTLLVNSPGAVPAALSGIWAPHLTIATGDLNRDGRTDLLLYDPATGAWSIGVARGAGRFDFSSGEWSAGWTLALRP